MQNYITEAENEYVIRGNSAIIKCKIPSFIADFVSVDAWIADDDTVYTLNNINDNCKSLNTSLLECLSVLSVHHITEINIENIYFVTVIFSSFERI